MTLQFNYDYNININSDINIENKKERGENVLKKKGVVQKTFRIDYDVNKDFETLCDILERSQNDLANVAIQELLEDNKIWLAKNILVEYASDFFLNGSNVEFELCGIKVKIKYNKDESVDLRIEQKSTDGETTQTIIETYENDEDENIKKIMKKLRYYGTLIDFNSLEVQTYLNHKLNYK